MKNKVNYIIGGIMAFLFSLSAATGVMVLTGWPFKMRWIPSFTAAMLNDWFRRIHLIVGLLLIVFVIFHIYRNWAWIAAMTEIIKQERENEDEPGEELDEEGEIPVEAGTPAGEVPIDVIDEDDFLDDDDDDSEPADSTADDSENDEGNTPKK